MIFCDNLVKYYLNRKVIDNVSFSIKPGEILVATGPSGAGKSTLLKLASLIETPTEGIVRIEEKEYKFDSKNQRKVREQFPKLGVVFQNLFLWPHLTNKENILLPQKNFDAKKEKEFDNLIKTFGITEFLEKYPNHCSLGQRQRVALVRAFLLNPKYLFLDEITSSLDIEQIGILLNYLRELKSRGIAIFLITHFLKFAQIAADQILFLEKGIIIEYGKNDILTTPKTDRLKAFITSLDDIII
jgi:ABC-type polar amino acid transport system ATPase subunit